MLRFSGLVIVQQRRQFEVDFSDESTVNGRPDTIRLVRPRDELEVRMPALEVGGEAAGGVVVEDGPHAGVLSTGLQERGVLASPVL